MLHPIKQFLSPPVFADAQQTRLANWIHIYFVVSIPILLFMLWQSWLFPTAEKQLPLLAIFTFGLLVNIPGWVALKCRQITLASFLAFLGLFMMVTYPLFAFDGIRDTALIGYFILLTTISFFSTPRITIATTVVCLVTLVMAYFVEQAGYIRADFTEKALPYDLVFFVLLFLGNTILLLLSVRQMRKSVQDAQQVIHQLEKNNQDLTQSLQREQVETRQTTTVLDSIADGVLVFDDTQQVQTMNHAVATLLGLSTETILNTSTIVDSPTYQQLHKQLLQTIDHRTNFKVNLGTQILSISQASVPITPQKQGTVTVLRDITKAEEVELIKETFISLAIQELHKPLTKMEECIELIHQSETLTVQQQQLIQIVHENTKRLNSLIGDLQDVVRLQSDKTELPLEKFDITLIVEIVVAKIMPQFKQKHLTLQSKLPLYLPQVKANPDYTKQILFHLLNNAYKYTEQGRVIVSTRIAGNFLHISVQDTGIGIAPADQRKIFTRFFRAQEETVRLTSGTGLGLSIAQALAEQQGGKLWFESVHGKGSTFTFSLPIAS